MPVNYKQVAAEILPHLQNFELKTFDIIYKPEESDTSPVICIEHNLGIESWCVKDVYLQAYDIVFHQTPGTDSVHYDTSILILLLLNPNIKTLWNKRRTSTLDQKTNVTSELNFTKLVLTRKPKSQDALNYRKWLLKVHHLITYEQFVSHELDIILDAASRHENNHVVWDYGIWYLNSTDSQTLAKLCVTLWDQTGTWISKNVSDYSALHFRQFLIEKLTNDDLVPLIHCSFKKKISIQGLLLISSVMSRKSDENIVCELYERFEEVERSYLYSIGIILIDLELNENLISFYHDHEALWNHRRFLCYYFSLVSRSKVPDQMKLFSDLVVKTFSIICDNFSDVNYSNLFEILFSTIHNNFLNKCQKVTDQRYTERYIDWLKKYKILS